MKEERISAENGTLEKTDFIQFNVLEWICDDDGECPVVIDILPAVSEYHAKALLRDRIKRNLYHAGVWLDYILNGQRIELDVNGRVA